jgi:hypothetical protein
MHLEMPQVPRRTTAQHACEDGERDDEENDRHAPSFTTRSSSVATRETLLGRIEATPDRSEPFARSFATLPMRVVLIHDRPLQLNLDEFPSEAEGRPIGARVP